MSKICPKCEGMSPRIIENGVFIRLTCSKCHEYYLIPRHEFTPEPLPELKVCSGEPDRGADLNCPACGGSGHVDDTKPTPAKEVGGPRLNSLDAHHMAARIGCGYSEGSQAERDWYQRAYKELQNAYTSGRTSEGRILSELTKWASTELFRQFPDSSAWQYVVEKIQELESKATGEKGMPS